MGTWFSPFIFGYEQITYNVFLCTVTDVCLQNTCSENYEQMRKSADPTGVIGCSCGSSNPPYCPPPAKDVPCFNLGILHFLWPLGRITFRIDFPTSFRIVLKHDFTPIGTYLCYFDILFASLVSTSFLASCFKFCWYLSRMQHAVLWLLL